MKFMNLAHFTTRLSHNATAIESLVRSVPEEQARWKPEPEAWSILEVINHLYDEECEDRIRHPGHRAKQSCTHRRIVAGSRLIASLQSRDRVLQAFPRL